MKKMFPLGDYIVLTELNFKTRVTNVKIMKNDEIVFDQNIERAPFAIDYAALIENIENQ